jgi:hypothetical protein
MLNVPGIGYGTIWMTDFSSWCLTMSNEVGSFLSFSFQTRFWLVSHEEKFLVIENGFLLFLIFLETLGSSLCLITRSSTLFEAFAGVGCLISAYYSLLTPFTNPYDKIRYCLWNLKS